ncbi:MAG: SBBP repeat-containing protein, partial [Nitrospirota bacterium]|nr:SBBP repeat-containing protein [Nitrospirota bacterium]
MVKEWGMYYGGPADLNDVAKSIAVDASGNVYVTGYSTGSGTSSDYFTIKYNAAGTLQWGQRYNGTGSSYDEATAIAVDASGNVYTTGYSTGSGSGQDYYTIKYGPDGAVQWEQRYNGTGNSSDSATAIAVDASGNVYVTGYSTGAGTSTDYYTIKYDPTGTLQWGQRYNGTGSSSDSATAIAVDASGNVYVTGYSTGSGTFTDYFTIKYGPTGTVQWEQRYNGTGSSYDKSTDIAVDASGNVYVTGYSTGTDTFTDYFTIKYNAAGTLQWGQRYNGTGSSYDEATAIAVDASGNVYTTGYSTGLGTSTDYFTIKYDAAGTAQWGQGYNGTGNGFDKATDLAVDAAGNVYVTGYSTGQGTSTDYFTIKYDPAGAAQWEDRFNGTGNLFDSANAISCDAANNIYITGYSTGSTNNYDYYTIKYVPEYTLSVSRSGTGSGTVSSSPQGINCGTDCTEDLKNTTTVTLTATPDSGSLFAGWSGDPDCSDGVVTMNS